VSEAAKNCKICGALAKIAFRIPSAKLTGQPIPDAADDCAYFECSKCQFLFTDIHDADDHAGLYDDKYWEGQDPDWSGRVNQTLRLVLLANTLINKPPWELKILDFGCGMGTFVSAAREQLQMQTWGTDIIMPKFGREWFLPRVQRERFDIIVACEVVEHLPHPLTSMKEVRGYLDRGGVFAFQTAYYDPKTCGRDWWYIGPANGHVSLYSARSFEIIAGTLGVKDRRLWNNYPGLQAWQF
jgi:SAM-dependent methyltransferase